MALQQVIEVEDQELWTRSGRTVDVQMDAGICLALSHEWCTLQALRRYNDLGLFFSRRMPGMNRIFSFQRGFNLVSDSLSVNATYAAYYRIDEDLTHNMITRDGRRSGVLVQRTLHTANPAQIASALNFLYKGDVYLLAFWGADGGGENWGHATAVGWPGNKGNAYFFDPNDGLSKETASHAIGTDIIQFVDDTYDLSEINDFVLYRYQRL